MAMARRVRPIIRSVMGFAEGRRWVERNVALSNIDELKIRHVVTSNPAIERPADLGRFLLRLDDCNEGSVAHGFRATYRTIAHEHLGIDPIVLELSLSHRMPGALGAVYARAQLLVQRREAAQQWADYLDQLRQNAARITTD